MQTQVNLQKSMLQVKLLENFPTIPKVVSLPRNRYWGLG